MATRFYLLNSGAPVVSPAYDSDWEQQGQMDRVALVRKTLVETVTTLADKTITVPITTTQDIGSRQYVSGPLRATRISGTFALVIRCSESANTANAHIAISLRVCSNDGGTFRGTLYSVFATATEFTTAAQTRIISNVTLTDQVSQFGDRLVLEIGVRAAAPTAAQSAIHRFGNSAASDFALTSGLTTDLNPWCEFSQDLWPEVPESYKGVTSSGLWVAER